MGHIAAIHRLRWAFGLGLGFITVVVVAAQAILAEAPADNAIDVHVVSLAGRQQMLCQRITKTAFMIHDGAVADGSRAREELDSALSLFARTHHALRHGDPDLGLPGDNSPTVETHFGEIDRAFRDVSATGEALLAEPTGSEIAVRLLVALRQAEQAFVPGMDAIIAAYEQETVARVKRFRDLETLISALTFLSLAGIALGLIRPVVRSVETEMQRRKTAEAMLQEQAVQLRDAAEAAEAAGRAKARFLASMSHEMRTPLNGIIGMAHLMEDDDLGAEQRSNLGVIHASSRALLSLISDVLDIAKIDEDRLEFESVAFDLHDLVAQTLRVVEPNAGAKRIAIAIDTTPSTPHWVTGDPTRLRQVLLNLLGNAVKFTEAGHVSLRVDGQPTGDPRTRVVRFEVTDTGIGIDPRAKARLFEPFTQADESTTRRFGGSGLGLAISHRLVAGMGGTLDFDSVPGEGTTFHFELEFPIADAPVVDTSTPDARAGTVPGMQILVVDDVKVNRVVARKLLERLGHTIDEAEDGLEAVAAVQRRAYDLVLMDLQMPNLDGEQAMQRIRGLDGQRAGVPIVALTANAMSGDRDAALEAGFDDYLSKPIDRQRLDEVLRRFAPGATGVPA